MAEKNTPAFAAIPELNKSFYLDSLLIAKERFYLDSITAEKVFLGFTFKQVKEKELNLGLDLRGGMNVMLEVKVYDLVSALANHSTNPQFVAAMNQAQAIWQVPAPTSLLFLQNHGIRLLRVRDSRKYSEHTKCVIKSNRKHQTQKL